MTPQMMEHTATKPVLASMPSRGATMLANAWPQVADCMPNQPMQAMAMSVLITYLAPFSPRAPEAMTATGRPVSQACMPINIMYTQMRP